MIRVSILGASGYSGGELLRLLYNRTDVEIRHVTSESSGGQPVHSIHPHLRGRLNLTFENLNVSAIAKDSDVAFLCYPAGVGVKPAQAFLKAGVRVIDLSADFRLKSAAAYKTWYKDTHGAPQLLKQAVYGLPELFRNEIKSARLIANPGCYATASALAAAPLIRHRLVDPQSLIIDAKSGVSGAGKKIAAMYMYSEVDENLQAYNVAKHRHQPEIEQVLTAFGKVNTRLTFTPHLVPMNRGILAVLYATLKRNTSTEAIRQRYIDLYRNEPFIRILPAGELPQTKNVVHTNFCDIAVTQDPRSRRVIVLSAIDNLVKGAAGQAIQNMNLCFDCPETEGLL